MTPSASSLSRLQRAASRLPKDRAARAPTRRRRQQNASLVVAGATSSSSSSPSTSSTVRPRGSVLCRDGSSNDDGGVGDETAASIPSTTTSSSSSSPSLPGAVLASAAASLGVVLFAVTRLSTGGITLADVAALSVPLDTALASGKPTIIEFYADYCDVCKSLAPESAAVARAFGGGSDGSDNDNDATTSSSSSRSLNFVLLNADNARWAPEIAEYGVRGVPHFVFLGSDGVARGAAVGRLPPGELEADAEDLVRGNPLSIGNHGKSFDAGSPPGEVTMLRGAAKGGAPEPRAHG